MLSVVQLISISLLIIRWLRWYLLFFILVFLTFRLLSLFLFSIGILLLRTITDDIIRAWETLWKFLKEEDMWLMSCDCRVSSTAWWCCCLFVATVVLADQIAIEAFALLTDHSLHELVWKVTLLYFRDQMVQIIEGGLAGSFGHQDGIRAPLLVGYRIPERPRWSRVLLSRLGRLSYLLLLILLLPFTWWLFLGILYLSLSFVLLVLEG